MLWIRALVTIRRDSLREYERGQERYLDAHRSKFVLAHSSLSLSFFSLSGSFIKKNPSWIEHSNSTELCWWRFPSRWKHNGPQQRDETWKRNKKKKNEEERRPDEALEGLRWMFRPLVWPLQKIVKEQTSDSLAVITVAKEMQQQQDQTAASRTPQYYDCRIYEPLEWNSIWLFFFSSLSLRFSLFFLFMLQQCCVRVVPSFLRERVVIVFIYGWVRLYLLSLLLHSNDRDMKNSIIINQLREAEAGLMWWNFTRSREKKRTEGDRVGVKWNPIEISYTCIGSSKFQKKPAEITYFCSYLRYFLLHFLFFVQIFYL